MSIDDLYDDEEEARVLKALRNVDDECDEESKEEEQ